MNPIAANDHDWQALESEAQSSPRSYALRVMGMVLLGYGYIAGLLVLLLALVAGLVVSLSYLKGATLKLLLPVVGFIWLVLRSLWVRLDEPPGLRVAAAQAPELFAMIEHLRRRMRAPRFHRVLVDGQFNAAVVQVPRLGMFGWHRNYLLIGLPLMTALTRAQFEAVLAHEFGHLAGGHGRSANWIYRLRRSWHTLLAEMEQRSHWGSFMVRPFFRWYVARFDQVTFPLARLNEYQADGAARTQTSPDAAAQALTAVEVVALFLSERYWPAIYDRARDQADPVQGVYEGLTAELGSRLEPDQARALLDQALRRRTSRDDTHPSLKDRLAHLGQGAALALPAPGAAADTLLGTALPDIMRALQRSWGDSVGAQWRQWHEDAQADRQRLAELRTAVAGGDASLAQAQEAAFLDERVGAGPEAALGQLRALLRRHPDDAALSLAVGQRLVGRDDDAAIRHLEHAIALSDEAIAPAAELLRDLHARRGGTEDARRWGELLDARCAVLEAARVERDTLYLADALESHGLDADTIEALRADLAAIVDLKRAYLVRKRVAHLPEYPLYVLGFRVAPWLWFHRASDAEYVRIQILNRVELPGETFLLSLHGPFWRFHRRLRDVPGSRIA
jgi:Zn-dependent protease with chaperone function